MLKQIIHLCALLFEIIPLSKIIFTTSFLKYKVEMSYNWPKKSVLMTQDNVSLSYKYFLKRNHTSKGGAKS